MLGQINLGTEFGNILSNCAGRDDVKTIVEIGAWNGMGSTCCIADGILKASKSCLFMSFEANADMYNQAQTNLNNSKYKDVVKLLHGAIVGVDEFPTFESGAMVREWYDSDVRSCQSSTNYFDSLPDVIDFLFIDGGEYTGYIEYLKLKNRSNIIALDDTTCFKTKRVRAELLLDATFGVLHDSQTDRNGCSVFVRKQFLKG